MKESSICGIYCIEAIGGNPEKIGWKYVGQSVDCEERWPKHFRELKHQKHHSPKLQKYYDKYGKKVFKTYMVTTCDVKDLDFWEIWFVKTFDSYKHGFNCTAGGDRCCGENRKKSGTLQNVHTGEIVAFKGMSEFARENNLNEGHLSAVLSGDTKTIHGWILPENFKNLKKFKLIHKSGEVYEGNNIPYFCETHQIKTQSNIYKVISGERYSSQGWKLFQGRGKKYPGEDKQCSFSLMSPTGEIFQGKNQSSLAKKLKLSQGNISMLVAGKIKSYRGWKLNSKEALC